MSGEREGATEWLVLIHQFPQRPGSLRVKVWRRLQGLGAVAIKHSMYALPRTDQTREDFAWLLKEIVAGGGEGAILEARFLDGLDDQQVRGLFNQARDAEYSALSDEARGVLAEVPEGAPREEREARAARQQLSRLERRLNEIEAIDFFGADGRGAVQGLIGTLAERLASAPAAPHREDTTMGLAQIRDLEGQVWVTRRGVKVDRIASAWLIKRWIDPGAVFKFTSDRRYRTGRGEVRFDMFEAEFTHEGDRCTFEVLLERAGIEDPALRRIAEVVHDIDLKDGKFSHEETPGVASLLAGITIATDDDDQRIARGSAVFESLYESFSTSRPRRRSGRARP